MCGVIGILGDSIVAPDLWVGLISMQHRGQDAAGIVTYSGDRFHLKKGKGTVQSLFTEADINRLIGNVGIGHVRYPTIGAGDPEDAQPFYTNTPYGIAIAHNGNVINYSELKSWLIHHQRHINTSCDAEVILNLLALELEEKSIFDAVCGVMDKVNGSYSCVAFIANHGLLAFRDPHGVKPLKFGRRDKSFCFASESVALDTLGYEISRDVAPGEAIFVSLKGKVSSKQIKKAFPRHCIFEYIYFARPDSILDSIPVYEARFNLGKELGKEVMQLGLKPDVVIPVPDTARTTAQALAHSIGVPHREGLIKNRYIARTFIMPRDTRRMEYVRYKLNPIRYEIEGKRVLLVDDSIVRGTTSKAIVTLVRKAKPKAVYFASSCPPLKYPCFYGIDMQTRQEFIARKKSITEIRAEIGADELVYQSFKGMLKAVGGETSSNKTSYCTACFSGKYPTKIPEREIRRIEKERSQS
ncbi:MAG: amidophosphoribosyltransferase [bacterium]|nr:amidophosphoribosyltransferase [bacterium]